MPVIRHVIAPGDGARTAIADAAISRCADPSAIGGPITALVEACGERPWAGTGPVVRSEGLLGELASRPGRTVDSWVATAGAEGECVGIVTLVTTAAAVSVGWLLVHPGWRRRGIGRALVAAAVAGAAERGRGPVTADTRSDWAGAVAFWQALSATDGA